MIAHAEAPTTTHQDEHVLVARFQQAAFKIIERQIDGLSLPHSKCRLLERQIKARLDEILARAAADCLAAVDGAISEAE
jgi:hypothetical protein